MKLPMRSFVKIAVLATLGLTVGCRPTIEFTSDTSNAAPGEEVTLEWDVELARGTSSSKVNVTDIGEVEIKGEGTVTVDETTDFHIRVSTFVLGFPISSKETLTITVNEDNFETYDFEDGDTEGWNYGYAFYDTDKVLDADSGGVLCNNPFNTGFTIDEPMDSDIGKSLVLCSDNKANNKDDDGGNFVLGFVQKKISDKEGNFEIESETDYQISYEVIYGVELSEDTCTKGSDSEVNDRITSVLSNVSLIVGAGDEKIETDSENDIKTLKTEALVSDELGEQFDVPDEVDGPSFDAIIVSDGNTIATIRRIDKFLSGVSKEDPDDDNAKTYCDPGIVKSVFSGISDADSVTQTSNSDGELWLMFGIYNKTDEKDIRVYIDQIKVKIEEQ